METQLKTLYEMLFPYSDYYGNRPGACIQIEKELKNLCKKETRHILLLVARYLGIKFTRETTTNTICGEIQKHIQNVCLSIGTPMMSSSYVIGRVTGIPPTETKSIFTLEERMLCDKHPSLLDEDISYLDNDWSQRLANELKLKGRYLNLHIESDSRYRVSINGDIISLEEAPQIWSNPSTSMYIFIPILRVVGPRPDIIRYFTSRGVPENTINQHADHSITADNYTTSMKELYTQEIQLAKRFQYHKDKNEVKTHLEDVIYLASDHVIPQSRVMDNFIDKIASAIVDGQIQRSYINSEGQRVMTKFKDVCKM